MVVEAFIVLAFLSGLLLGHLTSRFAVGRGVATAPTSSSSEPEPLSGSPTRSSKRGKPCGTCSKFETQWGAHLRATSPTSSNSTTPEATPPSPKRTLWHVPGSAVYHTKKCGYIKKSENVRSLDLCQTCARKDR
eukprot:1833721-Pyramimonas_sp.AAC.1